MTTRRARSRGSVRVLVASITLAIASSASGCESAPTPEATLGLFLNRLESHAYADAVGMIRAEDGQPLTAAAREGALRSWKQAFDGRSVHFETPAVTGSAQLPQDQLRKAGASDGKTLQLDIRGTSDSPCVRLPPNGVFVTSIAVGKLTDGKWYLLEPSAEQFIASCPGG